MLISKRLLFFALVIPAALCLFVSTNTNGLASDVSCKNIEIISARGSGRKLGEREMPRFVEQLKLRIGSSAFTVNDYELGTEKQGSYQYPAKAIVGSPEAFSRGLGAQLSDGMGNEYGASVKQGVDELEIYLLKRINKCPTTKFVLGGYSQGAQVMGQALPGLSQKVLDKIVYVALFGDPKLYLPEGEGINPPACRQQNLSDWRRIVPNCNTDDGTLGARKPYISASMYGRVGLWCNDNDWICGSSKSALNSSGHEKYADNGGAIDDAARLIASKILKHEYLESHDVIELSATSHGVSLLSQLDRPSQGQDMIVLLDRNDENELKFTLRMQAVMKLADTYWDTGGRFGIVSMCHKFSVEAGRYVTEYKFTNLLVRGQNVNYADRTGSESLSYFKQYNGYCGSNYASNMDYGIAMIPVLNNSSWRSGAEKATLISSNHTPGDIPDPALKAYIKKRAIEIDPVNVYTVSPSGSSASSFEDLSNATGGRSLFYDEAQTTAEQAITQASDMINDRPIVRPSLSLFSAKVGKPIILSVWSSLDEIDDYITYRWDYDADGVWDDTTTKPFGVTTFSSLGEKIVHVEITGSDGSRASTVVPVTVSQPEPEPQSTADLTPPTDIHYTILATKDNKSTIRLEWTPHPTSYRYMLSIDGVHEGWLDNTRTSIELLDIDRTRDVTVELQAYDQNLIFGNRSGVVIPALSVDQPSSRSEVFIQEPEQKSQRSSETKQPLIVLNSYADNPEQTPFMIAQSRDKNGVAAQNKDATLWYVWIGILAVTLSAIVNFYRSRTANLHK